MASGFSSVVQQVAAKPEAVKGVVETLTAADVKFRVFADLSNTPQHPRFTNEEIADDLAAAEDFVGGSQGAMGFGINYRSSGVLTVPQAIGVYLRGCGMREYSINAITIGAIAGGDTIFAAGETYSAAAGAKTGVFDETISSPGTLKYRIVTGTALAAADVVTSGGDSATASGTNVVNAIKYVPRSLGQETLTIQRAEGNSEEVAASDSIYRLRGAMGTFGLTAQALDVFKAHFEFTGIEQYAGLGSRFTGVVYQGGTNAQLPKLSNATLQINGVTVKPDAFDFSMGNQVEMDPDVTTEGGADGYLAARISAREATVQVAPLRQIHTILNEFGLLKAGTTFPIKLVTGVSPWQIEFSAKTAQVRSVAPGSRAGLSTWSGSLVCCRGPIIDDDFSLYFR